MLLGFPLAFLEPNNSALSGPGDDKCIGLWCYILWAIRVGRPCLRAFFGTPKVERNSISRASQGAIRWAPGALIRKQCQVRVPKNHSHSRPPGVPFFATMSA